MVVPTHPPPRLVLVQPTFPFGRLKTLLDRPVPPSHLSQLLQRDLRGRVGAMVLQLGLLATASALGLLIIEQQVEEIVVIPARGFALALDPRLNRFVLTQQ